MVENEQKRYADYITVQELVRLRVENERLREERKKLHVAIGYAADLIQIGNIQKALDALEKAYVAALEGDE